MKLVNLWASHISPVSNLPKLFRGGHGRIGDVSVLLRGGQKICSEGVWFAKRWEEHSIATSVRLYEFIRVDVSCTTWWWQRNKTELQSSTVPAGFLSGSTVIILKLVAFCSPSCANVMRGFFELCFQKTKEFQFGTAAMCGFCFSCFQKVWSLFRGLFFPATIPQTKGFWKDQNLRFLDFSL